MATQEYGGMGGTAFAAQTITSIALRGGYYVDAIIINGTRYGGDGGSLTETLTLRDGEYIHRVVLRYGTGVHRLDIYTNQGRHIGAGGVSDGTGGVTRTLVGRVSRLGGRRSTFLDQLRIEYEPGEVMGYRFGGTDGAAIPAVDIHSIQLFAGQYVDAIEINGNFYGRAGGTSSGKLMLAEGEYIQAIAVRSGSLIDRLDIYTSHGRHIGAGGGTGGGPGEVTGRITRIGAYCSDALKGIDVLAVPDGRVVHEFGGSGGGTFEPREISSLALRRGSDLDALVVNGETFGGSGGGLSETLTLAEGEYVNRVLVRSGTRIDRLDFFTNHFRHLGHGGGDAVEVNGRLQLIGGRRGNRLDRLKLVMVADTEPATHWFGGTSGGLSVHREITSIALRSGNGVDAIIINGQQHGGGGGTLSETLTLEEGEFINCVTVRHDDMIRRLDIYTSRGRHIGGGGGGGGGTERSMVGRLETLAIYSGTWVDGLAIQIVAEDSERVITRGTVPSDGPERFEYDRITSVAIRAGALVDGIVINGNLHGAGGGGLTPTLDLAEGEYIDRVVLRHDNHQAQRLDIHTNLGRHIGGGGQGGWPTTIVGRVIGISGSEAHFLPGLSFKVSSEQAHRFGNFQTTTFAPKPIRESIALRRGDRIDGLVIDGTLHGTQSGGLTETLTLQSDEYIRKAVVHHDQWFIHRLELYTSNGRTLAGGQPRGTRRVVTGRIVAIGGASHTDFNGIVLSVLPDPIRVQSFGGGSGGGGPFPMRPFNKIALRCGHLVDAVILDDQRFGGGGGGHVGPLQLAAGEFVDELHVRGGREVDWIKVETTGNQTLEGGGGGGGYNIFRGEIVALGGASGNLLDRLNVMGRPMVPTTSPAMVSTSKVNFQSSKRTLTFDKGGFSALNYSTVFGHRWKHLQDMIRLPDHDGKRYYMGTWSGGHWFGGARGAVFVAELDPNQTHGQVIWCDVLNDWHAAGGFNHPGDLRRIGDTVVIAGQNWFGNSFAQRVDPMPRGNGGNAVLFYDVRTPKKPLYIGKVGSCWDGSHQRTTGEVDSITAIKADGRYYLSFSGLQCHAPVFSPKVPWDFISTGDIGSPSPVLINHDGVDTPCVVGFDDATRQLVYKRVVFNNGTLNGATTGVTTETLLRSNSVPNPHLGSGTTLSVNTLANGDNVLVFANVQSDAQIEIVEVDCV